jgi:hypothetical protein
MHPGRKKSRRFADHFALLFIMEPETVNNTFYQSIEPANSVL